MRHRALYAAFDRVPSAKGAAMHIAHAVRALERVAGNTLLACVADGRLPEGEREGRVEVLRLGAGAPDLVERVRAYRRALASVLEAQRATLRVCQFRDPWSGIPILDASGQRGRGRGVATVYEVNGLPSIEMPYRFPAISARTLERIRAMEQRCLAEADYLLTPSATLARNLERLGVDRRRITVIPNGADPAPRAGGRRPSGAPARYFLYFGALQPWQGVGAAIAALPRIADLGIALVICSSQPASIGRALKARARRLGVEGSVHWRHELTREELAPWIAHAVASVAPLTETPRNLEQGCCPLKILESMAAGTPVIASDLAPVRELVAHGEHGLLVRAGRPELLGRAMRALADEPALRAAMGRRARARMRRHYTWAGIEQRLERWYRGEVLAQRGKSWRTLQAATN
jgi:glycosyltransferase involved in cell wall biosynthesis